MNSNINQDLVFVDQKNNITYSVEKRPDGKWTVYSESKNFEKNDEYAPFGLASREDAIDLAKLSAGIKNENDPEAYFMNDDFKLGGKINVGDTYQWKTVEYDPIRKNNYNSTKTVTIVSIKTNGDIVGRESGSSKEFIIRQPEKYLNKKIKSKMEEGGVVGQEIVFDDNGEVNTGVIKEIHENTGNYIVKSDDGRTLLADKELDVISLGKMRQVPERSKRFGFFEDGGNIANENNQMARNQSVEAKHHAEELAKILTSKTKIEPWVVAKMERATTDLSDVTHYLEGNKFAGGGAVEENLKIGSVIYNQYDKEWTIINLDENSIFVRQTGMDERFSKKLDKKETIEKIKNKTYSFERKYPKVKQNLKVGDKVVGIGKYDDWDDFIYYDKDDLPTSMATESLLRFKKGIIKNIDGNKYTIDFDGNLETFSKFSVDNYFTKVKKFAEGNKMKNGGKLTNAQQEKFDKVMHEWKAGKLHSGKNGPIVTDQDQAIAIAYAEANSLKKMVRGGNTDSKSIFDLEYGDVFKIDRNPERPHTMTDQYFMFIRFSEKYAKPEGVSIEAAYFPGSYYGPKYDKYKEHAFLSSLKNGDITIISKEKAGEMLLDYQIKNKRFKYGGKMATGGGIDTLRDQIKDLQEELTYIMLDNSFSKSEKEKYISELKKDIADKKERMRTYYHDNEPKYAQGGGVKDNWVYWKIEKKVNGDNIVMYEKTHSASPNIPNAIQISKREYDENKYAHGGMTEHGLKRGDTIVYNSGNEVMVVDKNKNQKLVDLDKGERYFKGGQMMGWKHKMKAGGGVGKQKLKYSLNNVYMSTIETNGLNFKRASVVIYNSKNLNLTSDLLNKIKDLIQSYSGSSVVKVLKDKNKDYYFTIDNKMIVKKSNEFTDKLEKLMNANNFYLADVNLVKKFTTGVFWSGELNEDYFDLWAFLMNLKNFAKEAETRDIFHYEKIKQEENNYIETTFKRWFKESREAEENEELKKYKSINQKILKSGLYENGGSIKNSKMASGGGVGEHKNPTLNDSCTITVEGNIKVQPSNSYKPVYENDVLMLRIYKSYDKDGAYNVQLSSTNKFWQDFDLKQRKKRSKNYVDEIKSQISSLLQKEGIKLKSLKMITGRASMETGGSVDSDPYGTKKTFPLGSIVTGKLNPDGKTYKGKVVGYSKSSDDIYILNDNNKKIKLIGISVSKFSKGGSMSC